MNNLSKISNNIDNIGNNNKLELDSNILERSGLKKFT